MPDRPPPDEAADPAWLERRYRSLIRAFSDFVWLTDAEGRLVIDMPTWRAITGQTPEQIYGLGWLDGVHPEDRARVAASWQEALRTTSRFEAEYRVVGPGGTRHLEIRGAPVVREDGSVAEWIGWAADVTERQEAAAAIDALRDALGTERLALERVVNAAPAAIALLWGPRHEFRFWNRRYEDLVPPGRVRRGLPFVEALPEAVDVLPMLDRAYAGEEFTGRAIPVPFDDDRSFAGERYYDVNYTPIHDGGRPAGVLVVAFETTEEVRQRSDLERRLAAERQAAEQLQRAVLPERAPVVAGVDLAVRYLPAARVAGVGGDWYDAIAMPDGTAVLVIGDVAGRGLTAATAMVQLRSAARVYAVEGSGPAELIDRLSRHCLTLGLADFVTVQVGVLDPASGRYRYASAGHPPALVVPAEGEPRLLWEGTGPPIGAGTTQHPETTVELEVGATLVLYTDGLVEERRRPLDAALEDLRRLAAGPHADARELCDRLLRDRTVADDIALLACRRLPVQATPSLEGRFPARPAAVSAIRAAVAGFARDAGCDEAGVAKVKLAVSEAATNAVLHAYRDAAEAGELDVRAAVEDGELRVVVADDGTGIRPREDSPGLGLGLGLISALTTRVDFHSAGAGTEVHMAFRLADLAQPLSPAGAPAARPAPG